MCKIDEDDDESKCACFLRLCLGALSSASSNWYSLSGWQASHLETTAPLTSGGRKNLHGSLCQYLEKEGCPWTERWDLALLLLCQSYAEPN